MIELPEAPIEHDLYMKLPKGIEKKIVNRKMHVLKLINSLYSKKKRDGCGTSTSPESYSPLVSNNHTLTSASYSKDAAYFRVT